VSGDLTLPSKWGCDKSEVRVWGRIQNTKDLELRRGSRAKELKRQNAIELSIKKFF
jgi:hypothetical protein